MRQALVLGCGFTGARVAQRLRDRGWSVLCTDRKGIGALRVDVNDATSLRELSERVNSEMVVLHSVPVPGVVQTLRKNPPARIVYLSTTGVYGGAKFVDETTPVASRTQREHLRVSEELEVLEGPWSAMVLRPAAIYGPGRGIHAAIREGKYRLMGEGANYVSRIHVDDLALQAEAAMLSDVAGAYPVADDEPCTSREIAEYCAHLLNMPLPGSASPEGLGETRRTDRRVDGSAVRRLLGVTLRYPNYRLGIAACLEAESRALSTS
jgi:nucleoside-diphosphate-sugar epimerase